ncbi:fumarylacetoacetate hydrolase family protein [Pseudomonas sp. BF-R-26]|uniref:fumarylacetoacetate hydrolase family protein n=1 Tax=Pseudomonas sp. BF-R-26 TaxID=2832398 RepID=UPI001CC12C64|nr:fumarylacetoacetate hydrolase family protein [Pseudomonas sp. BF-R-26]
MSYKLLSFASKENKIRAGLLIGDIVHDVEQLTGNAHYATVLGILEDWEHAEAILAKASASPPADEGAPLASVTLHAPILYPGQIFAAGANYQDHIDEMVRQGVVEAGPNAKQAGERPWHFIKVSRSGVVGPGAVLPLPSHSAKVDWEIELAVVIGKKARNVPVESAMEYVAGYTIANDLSARDFVFRKGTPPDSPFYHDWIGSKNFDGACPMGPWIVPASDIPDPMNLSMKLWVDEVIRQDSSTRHMIFNIAEQIAELSARVTLNPGDVIMTGTPDGVGMGCNIFLKPGQQLRLWIEHIGELQHGFTA